MNTIKLQLKILREKKKDVFSYIEKEVKRFSLYENSLKIVE